MSLHGVAVHVGQVVALFVERMYPVAVSEVVLLVLALFVFLCLSGS